MYVNTKGIKYVSAKCRNRVPIEVLDGIFHEQLWSFLLSPTEIARHLEETNETFRSKEGSSGPSRPGRGV